MEFVFIVDTLEVYNLRTARIQTCGTFGGNRPYNKRLLSARLLDGEDTASQFRYPHPSFASEGHPFRNRNLGRV